jgi:cell division septation protein DedD
VEKNRSNIVYWVLVILLLLVVGGYLFRRPILNYLEKSYYTPEELEYLRGQTTNMGKPVATPPPAPVTTPEVAVEPEVVQQEQEPESRPVSNERKTQHYHVFHIFLAQFDNESEARTYAQRVKDSDGYSAVVVPAGDNVYKVSVLRYTSRQEAEEILIGLRSTDSSEFHNAWIEKY